MNRRVSHQLSSAHNRRNLPSPSRWWSRTASKWALIALTLIAIGFIGWWSWNRGPGTSVPPIQLEQAAPGVARVVTAARERVLAERQSAEAWGELGMVLLAHQFEYEANVCLEQAARLDPREFRWPYLLGVSLSVSDMTSAAKYYRKALSLRADLPASHLRLGELLLMTGEYDEAAKHFQTACRDDPADPRAHYDVAQLLAARGDAEKALPWARQAVQLAPDVKPVHEQLANLLRRLGQVEAAHEELRRAEQASLLSLDWRDPITASVLALRQDSTSSMDRAQSLLDQGRAADAIQVLRQACEDDDRNPAVACMLARTLIETGQLQDAEKWLARTEQRYPLSAEVRFQRGVVLFLTERYREAEQAFREAIRFQPNHSQAQYNLGHTLLKLSDEDGALDAFAMAVQVRPDYADAHINLGKIWLRRGNRERAAEHLRQAVQLKPQDAEARQLLEQANGGR